MNANAVQLAGIVAELAPLRHTPAGLPLLAFRLSHQSTQREAGMARRAECEVNALAIGDAATRMTTLKIKVGDSVSAAGFLNRKSRMSAQLILHINQIELTDS